MDRGTDVVFEPGQGQLFGPGPTADPFGSLDEKNLASGPCQLNSGGQSVGSCADHSSVEIIHSPAIVAERALRRG
jgi:hypothetical protein